MNGWEGASVSHHAIGFSHICTYGSIQNDFRTPSPESQHIHALRKTLAFGWGLCSPLSQGMWRQTLSLAMLRYGRRLMIRCLAIWCNAMQRHSADTDGTRCNSDCFHVMPLFFMFKLYARHEWSIVENESMQFL